MSSIRGYKFEQNSSHSFVTSESKTLHLTIVAFEKGDISTPYEERPAIRYVETNPNKKVPPSVKTPQ